ncbi:MAG: rhomboid family intramembrane serine protease [Thermoplasmatota archaeon]
MAIHERVWERDAPSQRMQMLPEWRPLGTWTLLGIIGAVYILQQLVGTTLGAYAHWFLFGIGNLPTELGNGWWLRPWTLITSTLSHSPNNLTHILFNGLVLFFFGPILERILGLKRFLTWFFITGAVSGVLQILITGGLALGASGALMFVFGCLAIIMPNEKVLFWGIIPMPFWAMGILYAFLDVVGAINPYSSVGNFAHLSGMAMGLWYGWKLKQNARQPGLK